MHLMRRPTVVLNAALIAATLVGVGVAYRTVSGSDQNDTPAASGGRTVTVSKGTVTATASATGTIQSAATAGASFGTSGTVTEIHVKVGDLVGKGQLLAKLDPAAATDTLDTAKANLTAARQSLTRANSSGSDAATVASLQAQVTQAEASVATAQRAVDGTILTAPIAGTVTSINGTIGSSAGSSGGSGSGSGSSGGSATGSGASGGSGSGVSSATSGGSGTSQSSGFVQLADLTSLQISASFAESDATKIKTGQSAAVTWSALSGTTATAKVASIAPTASTANNVNTYPVIAKLDSVPAGARLGQSATVVVTVEEATDVLRLPINAVRATGRQYSVQVKSGDKTETKTVGVGVRGDQYFEITSGVAESDQVIVTVQVSASRSASTNGNSRGGGGMPGDFGGGPAGGLGR